MAAVGGEDIVSDQRLFEMLKAMRDDFKSFREEWTEEKLRSMIHQEQEMVCSARSAQILSTLRGEVASSTSVEAVTSRFGESSMAKALLSLAGVIATALFGWLGYTWSVANNLDKEFAGFKSVPAEVQDIRTQTRALGGKIDLILSRMHRSGNGLTGQPGPGQ